MSMDVPARSEISKVLGVEPLALCPSDLLPYNRPRLAWLSCQVWATPGVTFEPLDGFTRVHMAGAPIADHQWLEDGWRRVDPNHLFATFMKSIVRRRPPKPAGLARCDQETIARWESDSFRFPPYQYKLENLVQDNEGNLRYLAAGERELLLEFGYQHTQFAMSASQSKHAEQEFEDKRPSLCGDSFSSSPSGGSSVRCAGPGFGVARPRRLSTGWGWPRALL